MVDKSRAAFLLPSPSHMSIFSLGTLPREKQCGRCSPHRSFDCCDFQGSKHQAGQVAALNGAPLPPAQVPLASGAEEEGGAHLGLRSRRNKCCLQKEKPERIPLILKAGKAFLLVGSFSDNRKHNPEGDRRKKTSPYGIT